MFINNYFLLKPLGQRGRKGVGRAQGTHKLKTQDHVRRLLIASQKPDREVARAIGRSHQWVWLFRNNEIKAPSVDTMDDLHRFLTGRDIITENTEAL